MENVNVANNGEYNGSWLRRVQDIYQEHRSIRKKIIHGLIDFSIFLIIGGLVNRVPHTPDIRMFIFFGVLAFFLRILSLDTGDEE